MGITSVFLYLEKEKLKLMNMIIKFKIESAEADFESDESTLDYGKKRVENDLIEAFSIIKKENIKCLVNYKRFSKIIKKPKKKVGFEDIFLIYLLKKNIFIFYYLIIIY